MTQPFEVNPIYVEKLFIHLYCDLGQRSETKDDFRLYHRLNMARLIRQLLIDGTGVFNLANRYHKLTIRFIIPKIGPKPDGLEPIPEIYAGQIPDLNNYPPGYYHHPFKLDGYMGYSPMTLSDRSFTVIEIVKYVANQFGGVHLAPYLKDEDDQLLARFNEKLKIGNEGVVLNRIDEIAKVTLHALAPLRHAIEGKLDGTICLEKK
jgi:hypothetical protein